MLWCLAVSLQCCKVAYMQAYIHVCLVPTRAVLGTDSAKVAVGKQRLKPEGIWYTTNSGIWQTVWLEPVRRFLLYPPFLPIPKPLPC